MTVRKDLRYLGKLGAGIRMTEFLNQGIEPARVITMSSVDTKSTSGSGLGHVGKG